MLIPEYQSLWDTMVLDPAHAVEVHTLSQRILGNKERYATVGQRVNSTNPVPWYFIGTIHLMECSLNFNTHLYNGDPLTARTIRYPLGRPKTGNPPFPWEVSATDALLYLGYHDIDGRWDIVNVLKHLEQYNGGGYWRHDIYTPYLWSRTNHYTSGKFEEILNRQTHHYDVHYNPTLISGQCGAAPIIKALLQI